MRKIYLFIACLASCLTVFAANVEVTPGSGTLRTAVNAASAGDVLILSTGDYTETSHVKPTVPLTIKADEGANPHISLSGCQFEITADFTIQGVKLESTAEALRILKGNNIYNVTVKDCELSGCPNYFIRLYTDTAKSAYVNLLTVDNCLFRMAPDAANEAYAIAAKKALIQLNGLSVKNTTFDGGKGTGYIIYLHPGEEQVTFPGVMEIDHCTFYNSTKSRAVYFYNINGAHVTNSIIMNEVESTNKGFCVYGANSTVSNCVTYNAPTYGSAVVSNVIIRNPYFVDAVNGNFQLAANSPAVNAATDGSNCGDPRWGVSTEPYNNDNDPYEPYKKPYSMAPTTNSVKVLWQMSEEVEPTEALVYYGTDSTNLDMQITTSDGWVVADEGYVHVVTLPNLQPNTRYYFTVGKNATRRYPKISWTKTAPEQGTAFRIFSISDIHGNSCNNWYNMQDFICDLNCDISLMNGDFVSSKGNDRNWNNYYFKPGEKFLSQVPCMSSPGNHETSDPFTYRWSSFYDYFHQFSHEGASEGDTIDPRGESYFHFVYGNMDVVVLNLNGDPSSPEFLPGSRQYAWADSILGTCTRPWIIICHHVGVHTTGYHGQWADEPRQMGTLFEKHAALGKRIISLSGDDHSFEHLYKDGVHYVRPGCGRNANYSQQKQLKDYQYSMFYKQVSCFSTFDMAADASHIYLTAYDSVGNVFYNYDFVHDGEVVAPSVNFVSPSQEVTVEDSIKLQWAAFDPNKDGLVSLYYSQNANATSTDGMTLIVANLPKTTDRYVWHTRNIEPKGKYYVYATITSAGQTYFSNSRAVVSLLEDTTPPPAPVALYGEKENGKWMLTWRNPTHLEHIDNMLEDFESGIGSFQTVEEEKAKMTIEQEDGALKCTYNISEAWETSSADLVFAEPADLQKTPTLSFKLKGNGNSISLRFVCKNMSSGHEDWWYTEKYNLSKTTWQTFTLDLRSLSAFSWYSNNDDKNHADGVARLCFCISPESAAQGTFYLDDIRVMGDVYPAPDYKETLIMRRDDSFPTSPSDGTEIYRGSAEECIDANSSIDNTYYYAAFAFDDRGNWSEPAKWCTLTYNLDEVQSQPTAHKLLINGVLYIQVDNKLYTVLGTPSTL